MRTVARRLALPAAAVAAALALTACQSSDLPVNTTPKPASQTPSEAPSEVPSEAPTTKAPTTAAPKPASTPKPTKQTGTGTGTEARTVTCTAGNTKVVASKVSRPINHLVLTVTNVGSRPCNALNAPFVGFDDPQAPIRIMEDSKPQAVVTLAPGESGYASVLLTGEPGPDTNGHTVRTIRVSLTQESSTTVTAPGGTFADDGAAVSYWQRSLSDALTY
ncbi:DUF4232 domain-containing protein [Streptomyces sp. NPDC048623]|uniref:DUF4232 domain-containing protein n=1 Tax=Streptomyces sp. NPDC048623 TaxID=3155761 RepID=UPI00343F2DA6